MSSELSTQKMQTKRQAFLVDSNMNQTSISISTLLSAILTRILFIVHGFFAVFLVVQNKNDQSQWWPVAFLFFLLIESGYALLVRRGEEYKYFWPSCFLYIMCVLPSVWIMEMDLLNERTEAREQTTTGTQRPTGAIENINATLGSNNNVWWVDISKETIAEKVGALGLTIGIIIGRWLLPRGAITREQLSALLIGYVGIAADILEVFELFDEEKLMYRRSITFATLFVFSWSLLSFCLVTTATTNSSKDADKLCRKNKVGPAQGDIYPNRGESKLKDEYIEKLKVKWRKDMEAMGRGKQQNLNDMWGVKEQLGLDAVKEVFAESEKRHLDIHGDIYGILTGIFMMDGPFLVFRLYCTVQFAVDNEMHIFYTCKNAIYLALLVYRLCILTCKGDDNDDEFYHEADENKLRNVQVAIVGTKYNKDFGITRKKY